MSDLGLSPGFDNEGWPVCSPGLRKLLTEGENAYSAVRLIAINHTLSAECEGLLPRLEAIVAPADSRELSALLDEMAPRFAVPLPQDWSAYVAVLGAFPACAVRNAFAAWSKPESHAKRPGMSTIFPTPGQLAPFATVHRNALAQMRYRARKAMEKAADAAPRVSDDERQRIGDELRALAANMQSVGLRAPLNPAPRQAVAQVHAAPLADDFDVI